MRTCITPCCPVRLEAYQAFRTVSTWIVQPGELWDRQLGALTGWRQKTDFTVAEIEMVKLTKKQIADVTGFQAIITTTAGDRSVGAKAQLPESGRETASAYVTSSARHPAPE